MGEPARRPATWDDLLRTPDDGCTYEVLGGHLEAQPRPLPGHNRVQARLAAKLSDPFDEGRGGPGGWWLLIEPDVRLTPNDIVAPVLVGWRRQHLPKFPRSRPIDTVPDWICEVVSPARRRRDRIQKADLYLRSGVPHYWIADVDDRTLEAYLARDGVWLRLGAWTDGDCPRVPPFDAVELDVGGLFPPPQDDERD
jgi:Uma2 family endonuclease